MDESLPEGNGSDAALRANEQAAYRYLLNQKNAPYLSELTLGLLHRFNNVFTGVLFLTDDCLARAASDEPMRERLTEIGNVLRLAHSFVDRVVHLHLAEDEDDASYYDVDAVIAEELEMLTLLVPKGVSIHHSASREPLCFYGSKRAFCEILLHLFENSGAILPREGGSMRITTQARENDGQALQPTVVIHDNGPGFAQEVLPRIFEPLFTTKAESGHAGLGLFRARHLARSIHGNLVARNHPEGGAEFTLTLTQTNPDSTS